MIGAVASVLSVALPREIEELPLPYLELNADGVILRANRAARSMHHPGQGNIVGSLGWDMVAADEKQNSFAAYSSLMASGQDPPVVSRSIFDHTGRFRTYQLHRSLMRDTAGKPVGMRIIGIDITETSKALQDARHAWHWLECAMASMDEAVILTDTLGVIRAANPAAASIAGVSVAQLLGAPIEEALPLVCHTSQGDTPLDQRTTIERHWSGAGTLLNRNSEVMKVEISTSPILDTLSGAVIGVVALLRKIKKDCDPVTPSPPA